MKTHQSLIRPHEWPLDVTKCIRGFISAVQKAGKLASSARHQLEVASLQRGDD